MGKKTTLGDAWLVRGVKPSYRRAIKYLKRAEGLTVQYLVNRALKMYLAAKHPDTLARAVQDEEDGRPLSGYRVGPAHREDDNDME